MRLLEWLLDKLFGPFIEGMNQHDTYDPYD